jgi:hypothetical protein
MLNWATWGHHGNTRSNCNSARSAHRAIMGKPGVILGHAGVMVGQPEAIQGGILCHLVQAYWKVLGDALGPPWTHPRSSCVSLDRAGLHVGHTVIIYFTHWIIWGRPGASWLILGSCWGHPGALWRFQGYVWRIFCYPGSILLPSRWRAGGNACAAQQPTMQRRVSQQQSVWNHV